MMKEDKCKECEHTDDFKGCALKHITTARKLLANGDFKGAEHQLSCVEKHLREM
ncbi:MAG: hypothetical protein ACFFD8_05460 [Candidatus Thorarchaeota archaeon]